jgi:hypothetical protein
MDQIPITRQFVPSEIICKADSMPTELTVVDAPFFTGMERATEMSPWLTI